MFNTKKRSSLADTKKWRAALVALDVLAQSAPGFRETEAYRERVQRQVQLLEFYERAEQQVQQGAYQDALKTLDVLTQLDPAYDIAALQAEARAGQAAIERQSLDDQYQQAVQQYRSEQYEACVNTLDTIRKRDEAYPDSEQIEVDARRQAELQRELRELYALGVEQMNREQWDLALATFDVLKKKAPRYPDVDNRLATARQLARLSALLSAAKAALETGQYANSYDKIRELQSKDEDYKQEEADDLAQQALQQLHDQAVALLNSGQYPDCLKALDELEQRTSQFEDIANLRAQAHEGIRKQELRARLDGLYLQAVGQLDHYNYQAALDLWNSIQQQQEDLNFPDVQNVEGQARRGLANDLYSRALGAVALNDPPQALSVWQQVRAIEPNFPDSQQVVQRAQVLQQKLLDEQRQAEEAERAWQAQEIAKQERRKKMVRGGLIAAGIVIVVLLLGYVVSNLLPALLVPPATATLPAATDTPTVLPTPVPTTPAPPPTLTPPPADTPTSVPPVTTANSTATALLPSSIYVSPDAGSRELTFVQVGELVTVTGRSDNSNWLYVQNSLGTEGYVSKNRFQWTGNLEELPVVTATVTGPTVAPSSSTSTPKSPATATTVEGLALDLWPLPSTARCLGEGTWRMSIFMSGHGGSGRYTYYWNNEKKGGPMPTDFTFVITGTSSQQGYGRVVSTDGLQLDQYLRINRPACP